MVQKWPFKALFWDPRLADTVMAAARSHRQIEAMALVLCCIKKNYLGHCGKGHFAADLCPHLGKK